MKSVSNSLAVLKHSKIYHKNFYQAPTYTLHGLHTKGLSETILKKICSIYFFLNHLMYVLMP
jgi:hypothetical protein